MGRSAASSRRRLPRGQLLARVGSALLLFGFASLLAPACGRTGLLIDDPDASLVGIDGAIDAAIDVPVDALPDSPVKPPPQCQPVAESCNGRDDDCNGQIDDGLAPIPCPGGGSRYCVAGRFSACPRRCEVCVPGSERICMLSYCRYWGVSTCAADGRSFGACNEQDPPTECAAIAHAHKGSTQLEQCALDAGYCVIDQFDLDHDGNKHNLVGVCDQVTCAP